MKRLGFIALCLILGLTTTACSAAVNQVNSATGGGNFKAVGSLWNDVPAMDGLGKPIDAELPTSIQLFMRTGVNLMMKGLGEGSPEWDWLMFSTTKTPDDVNTFYTTARMAAAPYSWASDASGCASGQSIGQGGVYCAFTKEQGNKQTGVLIIATQDEKTKETSVVFLRGESVVTPEASSASNITSAPPATKGAITMLNGNAPYGIDKRPMPQGLDLDTLLPKQVGAYTRVSTQGTIQKDGNSVYATYRAGNREIFVEFAVTSSAADAQETLNVALGDAAGGVLPSDPNLGSMGTEPSYFKVVNSDGAFMAWTRSGYYFSADAKGGAADLDAFMQAFPY